MLQHFSFLGLGSSHFSKELWILFSEEWFLKNEDPSFWFAHTILLLLLIFFSPFTTSSVRGISCYQVPFLSQVCRELVLALFKSLSFRFLESRSLIQWHCKYFQYFLLWYFSFLFVTKLIWLVLCGHWRVNMAGLRRSTYMKNNLLRNYCLQIICCCVLFGFACSLCQSVVSSLILIL